jgi:hypothetical protein
VIINTMENRRNGVRRKPCCVGPKAKHYQIHKHKLALLILRGSGEGEKLQNYLGPLCKTEAFREQWHVEFRSWTSTFDRAFIYRRSSL